MVKKIIIEIGFKEVWVLKDFFNLFVFGFLFTLIFFREENVHWNYIMWSMTYVLKGMSKL